MNYPMIFIHIPKTAGTSFRLGTEDYFGSTHVLKDYGPISDETSELVQLLDTKIITFPNFRQKFDEQQFRFLTGHIHAVKYLDYFDKSLFVTFLRDHIQRIVSEYDHHVRLNPKFKMSFQNFYRDPKNINVQHSVIGGFEALEWMNIGITERYDESLERINRRFQTSIESKQLNLGKKQVEEVYQLPDHEYEEISRLNDLDIRLYNKALEIFDAKEKTKTSDTPYLYKGNVRGIENNTISGWAIMDGQEMYAKLDIFVNGDFKLTVPANRYRKDIQEQKLKRSGMAGFVIPIHSLEKLQSGEVIEIKFHGTNQLVNNGRLVIP